MQMMRGAVVAPPQRGSERGAAERADIRGPRWACVRGLPIGSEPGRMQAVLQSRGNIPILGAEHRAPRRSSPRGPAARASECPEDIEQVLLPRGRPPSWSIGRHPSIPHPGIAGKAPLRRYRPCSEGSALPIQGHPVPEPPGPGACQAEISGPGLGRPQRPRSHLRSPSAAGKPVHTRALADPAHPAGCVRCPRPYAPRWA